MLKSSQVRIYAKDTLMLTADDIKKLNAQNYDAKIKKQFSEMEMPQLSQAWEMIETASKEPAGTPEEKVTRDNTFAERKENLGTILTPEVMVEKASNFLASIESGNLDFYDLGAIESLGGAFGQGNDEVKAILDKIKTRMGEERVKIASPLQIDMNKPGTSFEKFDIAELESVGIEGNAEIIGGLKDPNSPAGKTITFNNKDNKEFAAVEFDGQENAVLFMEDPENGQGLNYGFSKGGKFSKINEDNTSTELDPTKLNEMDKKALNIIQSSQKIWGNHTKGVYDKALSPVKGTQINEGEREKPATKINEGQQAKKEDIAEDQGTSFSEEPKDAELKDAPSVTGNDLDRKPTGAKEDYWKEGDIIEMMFKEWFLAAANSVTNWVVQQVEYGCAAIWNQVEKDYQERKALRETDKKTKDSTQTVNISAEKLADNNMKDSVKDNNPELIIQQIKDGKVDEVMNNPLLKNLLATHPGMKDTMFNTDPEKTVPLAINVATQMEQFANKYAHTAILDTQLRDQHAYDNISLDAVFAEKKQEAYKIVMLDMERNKSTDKDKNPALALVEALNESVKKIEKAHAISQKDLANGNYNEKGNTPSDNPIFEDLKALALPRVQEERNQEDRAPDPRPTPEPAPAPGPRPEPEPRGMADEAADRQVADERNDQQNYQVADEDTRLKARESALKNRRERCETYRNSQRNRGLTDKGNTTQSIALTPPNKNIDFSTLRYVKDRTK